MNFLGIVNYLEGKMTEKEKTDKIIAECVAKLERIAKEIEEINKKLRGE